MVSHDRDFLDRVVTAVIAAEGNGTWTVYAGGYSDMIAQRRGARRTEEAGTQSAARATPSKKTATKATTPSSSAAKLSFTDRHQLETLPQEMEKIQGRIDTCNAKLAENGLFERDPKTFEATAQELQAATAALEAAEEQWLALELKREEIEGG